MRPAVLPHDSEVCRLYLAGETIKGIADRYRCTDRRVRKVLTDNDVEIHWGGRKRRPPADAGLPEAEIKRLREAIGFHPSWVDRPEREYDRSYDDARETPHRPALVETTPGIPACGGGRSGLGRHGGHSRGGGVRSLPEPDRLRPGGVDPGQTRRDLGVHGCTCPDRQPHPIGDTQPECEPEPIPIGEPVPVG